MKCKYCDGTGKSNMYKDGEFVDCMYCGGTGELEVQMTNEEWLRSIGTRELAKELALLVLYNMPLFDRLHNVFEGGESAVIDECEKWLKEKHND